ncbi:MAG TPA: PHP domain-containing protein [Actinomycetota bacterium]|nr:PHP domain-containing protein [Actinomycetota bacterium]
MGGIDLHVHTTRSDGTFTPSEVVALARERGLSVIAITDHDTTEGVREALGAADGWLEVVPGVEFSAEVDGRSVHVLGYWVDPEHPELRAEFARLRDARERRGELMVERLRELGYPIAMDRVQRIAGDAPIVRPHIAQAMVEAGIVATEEEAFTEAFIADGGRAYVPKHALHPFDALELIRRAGGVCVLAHPGMWGGERELPEELIAEMAERGMVGLEVEHPDHTPEQRERYRRLARRLGLIATGASDCHGTRYDPVRLGCCTTDPGAFAQLRERAGR